MKTFINKDFEGFNKNAHIRVAEFRWG